MIVLYVIMQLLIYINIKNNSILFNYGGTWLRYYNTGIRKGKIREIVHTLVLAVSMLNK